jgi:elongation factor G
VWNKACDARPWPACWPATRWWTVEVTTPMDHVGDVIGDLNRRRGQVRSQDQRGNAALLRAMVPLQTLFGYIGSLRALTAGRASYTMQFDHYAEAPRA